MVLAARYSSEVGQQNQEAKAGGNIELISDKPAQAVIGIGAYQDVKKTIPRLARVS